MTDNTRNNSSRPPGITKFLWGGRRLTHQVVVVGIGLFFWGLYEPMNGMLIVVGIAVSALGIYLRDRTQFGRPGRPIVEEEFVREADGSIKNYKLRLKLTKFEILLHVAGFLLIVVGVDRSTNWLLIASGICLIWMGQLYGNWLWFGSVSIGFSDSLSLAHEKLRKIGDEIREEGHVVRRVKKGIQYLEGSHSLTLRSGWAFVEKERIQGPNGSLTAGDKLVVLMRSGTSKRRWDVPHANEKIPNEVLAQISGKISAALNSGAVFHVNS